MAFLSRDSLKKLLHTHCVEIKFQRKNHHPDSKTRRIFCVGAYPLFHINKFLNTRSSTAALNYRLPKGISPYPPKPFYSHDQKNLVTTWDILKMDYRNIYVYRCNVIRAFPVDTPENIDKFWKYYNKYIAKMTVTEKADFYRK